MKTIRTFSSALELLGDGAYSNSARSGIFDTLRTMFNVELIETAEFFSHWLMYMTGPAHRVLRARVLSILNSEQVAHRQRLKIDDAIASGSIDAGWVDATASAWHAEIFGMTEKQQAALFQLCDPLLRFLMHADTSNIAELDQCVRNLLSWFERETFDPNKIISMAMLDGIALGTIVNLTIDSFEPVKAGLGNILFLADCVEAHEIPPKVFVSECLRLMPPFRYISRRADANPNEKISIDLMSCNRDESVFTAPESLMKRPSASLSFGKGAHSCPGFSLSSIFLSAVWTEIRHHLDARNLRIVSEGTVEQEKGLCRTLDLSVRFVQRDLAFN